MNFGKTSELKLFKIVYAPSIITHVLGFYEMLSFQSVLGWLPSINWH